MTSAAHSFGSRNRPLRQLQALLCLALFLALQPLAGSSALHRALHADADSSSHHCAITLLAHGQVSQPVLTSALLVCAAVFLYSLPVRTSPIFNAPDLRLSPGRAPPLF